MQTQQITAAGLPPTASLSFGGCPLDSQSIVADVGICAESVLHEITLLQFNREPMDYNSEHIEFESDQRIKFTRSTCDNFATVITNGSSVKFEITEFDQYNNLIIFGIQSSESHSGQTAEVSLRKGIYSGDVIEVIMKSDGGMVTGLAVWVNGEFDQEKEVNEELKDDAWEIFVGVGLGASTDLGVSTVITLKE